MNKTNKYCVLLICLVPVAAFFYLTAKAAFDPGVPFLKSEAGAEWVRYPMELQVPGRMDGFAFLTTTISRQFNIEKVRPGVQLYFKAFRKCRIQINGKQVYADRGDDDNWKKMRSIDITSFLSIGPNRIDVEVGCRNGPPCVLLYTRGLEPELATNSTWTAVMGGGNTSNAAVADDTQMHPISFKGISPVEALRKNLGMLIIFFVISVMVFLLSVYRQKQIGAENNILRFFSFTPKGILVLSVILWTVLFLNNLRYIPPSCGFDAGDHIEYIEFVANNRSIPLASDGFEMYQPPLFYLLSAFISRLVAVFSASWSLYSLKLIPFLCGLGQIFLVYFAAGIIFAGSMKRQSLAVAVAAMIPMNIYMSHYVSNETLCALLIGLAILLTIKILNKRPDELPGLWPLTVVLGLSLLSKFTAMVVVPVILVILLYKLGSENRYSFGKLAKTFIVISISIFIIAGWFYVRNWFHFGKIMAAPWDAQSNLAHWQDPGFHTYKYFFRFGKVFTYPYFAGFYSLFDCLYSTFWGDSFYGGSDFYQNRPPWNYEYTSSVYLLSIPMGAALLIGLYKTVKNVIQTMDKMWLLVTGTIFMIGLSIVYLNLMVPFFVQAKAFYGLCLVMPLSLILARGLGAMHTWLKSRNRILLMSVLYGWLGTLIITIFLSFFVTRHNPEITMNYASLLASQEKYEPAFGKLNEVVRLRPNYPDIHYYFGVVRFEQARDAEAVEYFNLALEANPGHAESHYYLGIVRARQGRVAEAVGYFTEALRISPGLVDTRSDLARAYLEQGKYDEAVGEYRILLGMMAGNPYVHNDLGMALLRKGQAAEAAEHFAEAVRIKPDFAEAQRNLENALRLKNKR